MGWNDHINDGNEVDNLPSEAFSPFGGPFDPQDHWLRTAVKDDQLIAMRAWFLARYCDPANEMPYDGREGGYQFIYGGPYDPAEVLPERFSEIVSDDLIEEVIDEMHSELGDNWAPVECEPPDDYDDDFGVIIQDQNEPLSKLRDRLEQSQQVLTLEGNSLARSLAQKLAFSSVITALESFLWETVVYWVDHNEATIINIVTKIQVFSEKTLKLGDIFKTQENLKDDIKGYLQGMVWHNWKSVAPLFKLGLGLEIPSFKQFNEALMKRHDIVHRSGFTKTGDAVMVNAVEIDELCIQILKFANVINSELDKKNKELA